MSKIRDFHLFGFQSEVKGNSIKPVNEFIEFKREDIQQSVARRFEAQVEIFGEKIAVKSGDACFTYCGLNTFSNRIAHTIIRAGGGGIFAKGAALLFEHGIDMIPAILGVLKAGGYYIPLDPTYPRERLRYMLEDSCAEVIITNGKNRALAQELVQNTCKTVTLIDIHSIDSGTPTVNPGFNITPDHLAYILYTSGSTGSPKGVIQNQRNVLHFTRVYTNALHINSHDRLTLFSSYGFDAAKMDIYGALLTGAELYPFDIKKEGNLYRLAEWLNLEGITIFHSIPTVYRYFIDTITGSFRFEALRFIVLGGEAVFRTDIENYKKYFPSHCLFINGLGPTESTVTLQYFMDKDVEITKEDVPVGYAVAETKVLLLNEKERETRHYEIGEIIFKSDYLALGYLNNIEKTHDVFQPDPLTGDGRVYYTGDLGKRLPDSSLEYVGRKDFQVKVNGYRIELGGIEGALDNIEGVKKSVVVCKQDRNTENYLAAYYVREPGRDIDGNDLIRIIKDILPDFMVPRVFIMLERFPLTFTGKIDRKALPEPETEIEKHYVSPRDEVEEAFSQLWAEILSLEKETLGIDDNFFELGGQSFKAIILAANAHQRFDVNIPLEEIFNRPTIRELSRYVKDAKGEAHISLKAVEAKEYYPTTSAQSRLYFLQQLDASVTSYNILKTVSIDIDKEKLEEAFLELIQRHEAFRTSFDVVGDQVVQRIYDHVEFKMEYHDLSVETGDALARGSSPGGEVTSLIDDFVRSFDLSRAPLMRVGLIKQKKQTFILMLDMHHIITDGVSHNIFVNDLLAFYQGEQLPALPIQYKDFARWQTSPLRQEDIRQQGEYWLREFAGHIPKLILQTDYKRPDVQRYVGSTISLKLSPGHTASLKKIAVEKEVTLYMLMLSFTTIFLSKITRQEDIVIGTVTSGRTHSDLKPIIGMFVNTLALRFHASAERTFGEYLQDVKEKTLRAFENQDYPFEELVRKLAVKRDTGCHPLFDVLFSFHNELAGEAEGNEDIAAPGSNPEIMGYQDKTSKFDLNIGCFEMGNKLSLGFEYSAALFKRERISKYIGYYKEITGQVIANLDIKLGHIVIDQHLKPGNTEINRDDYVTFTF